MYMGGSMLSIAWRCYCLEGHTTLWFILTGFGLACVLYGFYYFGTNRIIKHKPWTHNLIQRLRLPVFCILMELAALFVLLALVDEQTGWTVDLGRLLGAVIIVTVGIGGLILAHELFHHIFDLQSKIADYDLARRSSVTQAIFLYRAVVIVIIVLTVGIALFIFPYFKSLGVGILGSAGILGIAVGMAARPILENLLAGFQIGLSKTIKIGDRVVINKQDAQVENIQLTRIILKTWDDRRILIPISQLIDQPFENWDLNGPQLIGTVLLRCDFSVPVDALRQKFFQLVAKHPAHDGRLATLFVTDSNDITMEIRLAVSSANSASSFELCAFLREQMIQFLQQNYPTALPCYRYKNFETPAEKI